MRMLGSCRISRAVRVVLLYCLMLILLIDAKANYLNFTLTNRNDRREIHRIFATLRVI
jgi:hypothetical protein